MSAPALTQLSGALQGAGQIASGAQSIAAGQIAASQAKINADLLEELGLLKADEVRRERGRIAGIRTVAFAKGGVNPNTGSALDVALDAAVEDELAALNAKFGFESQAFTQLVQGRNAALAGQIRGIAAGTRGVGTIISGGVSAREQRNRKPGGLFPSLGAQLGAGGSAPAPASNFFKVN